MGYCYLFFRNPDPQCKEEGRLSVGIYEETQPARFCTLTLDQSPIAHNPAAVVFDGKIHCFYQTKDSAQLWHGIYGTNDDQRQPHLLITKLSGSPTAVVFKEKEKGTEKEKEKLYCFYQGLQDNGQLRYSVFDNQQWQPDTLVAGTNMSESPTAVVFNDRVYCFYQSKDNHELRYSMIHNDAIDDEQPPQHRRVPNTWLAGSPTVVAFNETKTETKTNKLYCFYQSHHSDQLHYNVFDGQQWLGDRSVPDVKLEGTPAAVAIGNQIHCYYQDQQHKGALCCSRFDAASGAFINNEQRYPANTLVLGATSVVWDKENDCRFFSI